jgi:ABC-2 type transport system ATP-binding protein
VFAFLGPNGAGKTTTVEIIEGIRTATSGTVTMLGTDIKKDPDRLKPKIGVLPQEFSSFDKVTVKETLAFYSRLYKKGKDPTEMMKLLGIEDQAKKLYQTLSGGLKQRVGIAVALVNDPEIVFLDEPTTGLDPQSRHEVWKVIRGLKRKGKTIFLTTHYMEEAQELADHVAIINKGKIIAEGTVDQLIDRYGKGYTITLIGAKKDIMTRLKKWGKVSMKEGNINLVIPSKDLVPDVVSSLKAVRNGFSGISVRRSNLEEVFLSLTGKTLEQEAKP